MSDSAFLFDSNVWVALAFDAHPAHDAAARSFQLASKQHPACFCRATQLSFLRLATTPAILRVYGVTATTNEDALRLLDRFASDPAVVYLQEPKGIENLWPRLATRPSASPKLWMDAYLAAFALTGGYKLVTTDKAFTQFQGLEPIVLAAANSTS